MFKHMTQERELLVGGNGKAETKSTRSNAGPTPFHRAASYLPRDTQQRFKWLIYENNGSFNGWFDWLPMWMRVGYWSPFVGLSLVVSYSAIFVFKPQPLEFPATAIDHLDGEDAIFWGMSAPTVIDLFIFVWGIFVVVQHKAKISLGSISAFPISFTGWSWFLITFRAGLEFAAHVAAAHNANGLASKFATIGSSIRLVTITNACVVCTIWNFILLPIIYFKSIPDDEKRWKFLKFNFGFFMTNIHILNFPLAFLNILNGSRARLFTISDLWVAYLVIILYSIVYFFVMDRLGLHFYPIFNPRTAFSVISIFGVLGLYYFLFLKFNEYISLHANI